MLNRINFSARAHTAQSFRGDERRKPLFPSNPPFIPTPKRDEKVTEAYLLAKKHAPNYDYSSMSDNDGFSLAEGMQKFFKSGGTFNQFARGFLEFFQLPIAVTADRLSEEAVQTFAQEPNPDPEKVRQIREFADDLADISRVIEGKTAKYKQD